MKTKVAVDSLDGVPENPPITTELGKGTRSLDQEFISNLQSKLQELDQLMNSRGEGLGPDLKNYYDDYKHVVGRLIRAVQNKQVR